MSACAPQGTGVGPFSAPHWHHEDLNLQMPGSHPTQEVLIGLVWSGAGELTVMCSMAREALPESLASPSSHRISLEM